MVVVAVSAVAEACMPVEASAAAEGASMAEACVRPQGRAVAAVFTPSILLRA
jgi:hypothetical protein